MADSFEERTGYNCYSTKQSIDEHSVDGDDKLIQKRAHFENVVDMQGQANVGYNVQAPQVLTLKDRMIQMFGTTDTAQAIAILLQAIQMQREAAADRELRRETAERLQQETAAEQYLQQQEVEHTAATAERRSTPLQDTTRGRLHRASDDDTHRDLDEGERECQAGKSKETEDFLSSKVPSAFTYANTLSAEEIEVKVLNEPMIERVEPRNEIYAPVVIVTSESVSMRVTTAAVNESVAASAQCVSVGPQAADSTSRKEGRQEPVRGETHLDETAVHDHNDHALTDSAKVYNTQRAGIGHMTVNSAKEPKEQVGLVLHASSLTDELNRSTHVAFVKEQRDDRSQETGLQFAKYISSCNVMPRSTCTSSNVFVNAFLDRLTCSLTSS